MTVADQLLAKLGPNRLDTEAKTPLTPVSYEAIKQWKVSERTCRLYDYGVANGKHYATYKDEHNLAACQHVRTLDPKGFTWVNRTKGVKPRLYGQHLGSRGNLIIVEGEKDALCLHEALTVRESSRIVVVSIPDGVASAVSAIKPHLEWVLAFDRVDIFFDADEPGIKGAAAVAELIGPKARIVSGLGYKDCGEAWIADDVAAIKRAIAQAGRHRPDGVVSASDLMDVVMNPTNHRGHNFPWKGWNDPTEGMKPGELHLISAATGIGKSLFSRSIALNLARNGVRVAYLGYEESVASSYERMLSECMGAPMYRKDAEWRHSHEAEIREAAKSFASNLWLIDKFGSDDFETFAANVKHYVLNEQCEVVFLDHFSLLADGIALNVDQRRAIDKAIKSLKELAMELGFSFIIVCHTSRDNSGRGSLEEGTTEPTLANLRGSASLGQWPDYIWMLQRNPNDQSGNQNITKCWLKKNRVRGSQGMMCELEYNVNTCQFTEVNSSLGPI